jgi:hypothetical protein
MRTFMLVEAAFLEIELGVFERRNVIFEDA